MAIYRDYDQAALDDQYNNRKRVPDFQTTLDRWAADSAAVRAAGTGRLDIKYGPSERECLDIFPAHEGGPVLVFIHGGYWRSLDKDAHSFLASAINAAGIDLVMVGYPLAPQVTMDEIVAAVGRSFAWLWHESVEHGLDRERIFVSGHSAGGHLTASMMSENWPGLDPSLPADLIKGGCAISGLYDLEPIRLSFLNEDVRLDDEMARRQSPLHRIPDQAAPLILAVGEAESPEFHRQQDVYAAAWAGAGHDLQTITAPGQDHFSILDTLTDPESPLFQALAGLMGAAGAR
jgi:arylformamidase